MKQANKKLQSNKGASIVSAMVVFLVVTIIAMVIVQAALTNAARLKTQKKEEQAYLSVISAANLLEKEFMATESEADAEAGKTNKYIRIDASEEDGVKTYHAVCGSGYKNAMGNTIYGELLADIAKAWIAGEDIPEHHLEISSSDSTKLPPVYARIGARANGTSNLDVVCILSDTKDDSDDSGVGYAARLMLSAEIREYDENRTYVYFTEGEITQ